MIILPYLLINYSYIILINQFHQLLDYLLENFHLDSQMVVIFVNLDIL